MARVDYAPLLTELKKYVDYKVVMLRWNQLVESIKMLFAGEVTEWSSPFEPIQTALTSLAALFEVAIVVMEKVSADMPEVKRQKRDMVVTFLDDMIKLPWPLEWIDGRIIGKFVDRMVDHYNRLWGKDWAVVVDRKLVKPERGGSGT